MSEVRMFSKLARSALSTGQGVRLGRDEPASSRRGADGDGAFFDGVIEECGIAPGGPLRSQFRYGSSIRPFDREPSHLEERVCRGEEVEPLVPPVEVSLDLVRR